MNKKVSIWWFPVLIIIMGLFSQKFTNDKLIPLKAKEKQLLDRLDSLKYEREVYTLKYKDSLAELTKTYENKLLETNKQLKDLQYKKSQHEKAITEYNNSTLDDKFELLSNLIKKDSL